MNQYKKFLFSALLGFVATVYLLAVALAIICLGLALIQWWFWLPVHVQAWVLPMAAFWWVVIQASRLAYVRLYGEQS